MAEEDKKTDEEKTALDKQREDEIEAEARATKLIDAQTEGGRLQQEAADRAARESIAAANKAIARFENYMGTAAHETQHWRQAGAWAMDDLTSKMKSGYFQAWIPDLPEWEGFTADDLGDDPGYQFRLEQGEEALLRGANRGMGVDTGATRKALVDYGQKMGSQEFGRARERALVDYRIGRGEALEEFAIRQEQLDDEFGQLTGIADRGRAASESFLGHVGRGTASIADIGTRTAARAGDLGVGGATARAASMVGAEATRYAARMTEDERAWIDEMYTKYPDLAKHPSIQRDRTADWLGYVTAGVNIVDKVSKWFP